MLTASRPPCAPAKVPTAEQRISELLAQGYAYGPPPALTQQAIIIDQATCRRLRCPGCNRRGLSFVPFHRPAKFVEPGIMTRSASYRVLAACQACGGWEEV